jgi:hypothetical protein
VPVCGSVPIIAIMTPRHPAVIPRSGALPDSTATMEMPSTEKAKSSGEPMNSITGRKIGMLMAISSAPKTPPMSEDM